MSDDVIPCSIKKCPRPMKYRATGWCQTHYHRWWRNGSTDLVPRELDPYVSYRGAHGRVRSAFGRATDQQCIECGRKAREWAYDGTDPDELTGTVKVQGIEYPVSYSAWPEFYMPMCFGCHRLRDCGLRAPRRTHCKHGHELTPDNTYIPPSEPNGRECRTCRKENSARRYQERKAAKLNHSEY